MSWVAVGVVLGLRLFGEQPAAARPSRRAVVPPAGVAAAPAAKEIYRSALLMDAGSGTVLFENGAHRQTPPASMTKLMLMLLVAERVRDGKLHWDDPIAASRWASHIGGSQVYLKEGEVFSLAEMMQAIVIHSANDAAVAVAEAVAGSTDAFVQLMNERARALGMKDTVYRSVHGLPPGAGQEPDLSSAYDMAVLARQVVTFPEIRKWAGTKEATFRNGSLILTNTNRLVRETGWVDGLKTGYYRKAGFSVTATGQRDGLRLIAVVMGAPEKHECFSEAGKLLTKGFAEYTAVYGVKQGDVVANDVKVKGGSTSFVRVVAGGNVSLLSKRSEPHKFSVQLVLGGDLRAPLDARARVGDVVVKEGEAVIGTVPALAADAVAREPSFWERLF